MIDKTEVIVAYLKKQFQPLRLFLFGSRAEGTNQIDSDYDFVMVLSEFDAKFRYEMMSQVSSCFLHKLNVEVHVWIYSQKEFDDWKDEFSSIPEIAFHTGREIKLRESLA